MYTHRDEEFPQARNVSTWTQLEGSSSSQHVSLPVYDGFVGVAPAKSSTRERAASSLSSSYPERDAALISHIHVVQSEFLDDATNGLSPGPMSFPMLDVGTSTLTSFRTELEDEHVPRA